MKKFLLIVLAAGLLWFFLHIAITVLDGLNDNLHVCDASIVLGNKVERDGKPSQRLQSRLDRAVELYHAGYFTLIIVSGGKGQEGYDEAKAMKDYLLHAGIEEKAIIEDPNGLDTFMTAKNAKVILAEKKLQSVMVITQCFHVTRSTLALQKAGIKQVYSAHAKYFELRDVYSLAREFVGFYAYLLLK